MHLIALRPTILQEVIRKLQYFDKESLPLLMSKDRFDYTPLDIAIAKNQYKSELLLMEIMLKYQDYFWHNNIFDRQVIHMLENGYDLIDYFQSKLVIY